MNSGSEYYVFVFGVGVAIGVVLGISILLIRLRAARKNIADEDAKKPNPNEK
jgi:ABC-type antimicrobial peptide transport system permease subunit